MPFETISRTLMLYLESLGVDHDEGREIVKSFMNGTAEREFPLISSRGPAKEFSHYAKQVMEGLSLLGPILEGKTLPDQFTGYANCLISLREALLENPNPRVWGLACKHFEHVKVIAKALKEGNYDPAYVRVVSNRLQEDSAASLSPTLGIGSVAKGFGIDPDDLDAEMASQHEKFVNKIEKEHGFKAQMWEPMREALLLFTDKENTDLFLKSVTTINDTIENFLRKHDYILLKQSQQDVPEGSTRWTFLYCPQEEEEVLDKALKDGEAASKEAGKKVKKNSGKAQTA